MKQTLDLAAIIAQIKTEVSLDDVARRYGVELTGHGKRLEGHCPLPGHEDDTPSFNIYLKTQRYYCFGCDSGGDVIDFVRQMDACTFLEACERLLGKAILVPPPGGNGAEARRSGQRRIASPTILDQDRAAEPEGMRTAEHAAILTRAMAHYHQTILRAPFALEYLSSRGASLHSVKRCMLGYVDGIFRLTLLGKEHLWRAAEEVGLLTAGGHEWLSGRLIIPEIVAGRCTWLIGRVLPQAIPHRVMLPDKKYLGLPIDQPLLGYGRAVALLEGNFSSALLGIHIVEGAIDYVITQEWALPFYNLSLLGTHASREHLQRMLYLHRRSGGLPFIVNLDGDERGGMATLHLLEQLRGYPALTLPQVLQGKDLGKLAEDPHGYRRFTHALHAAGEGGEWL